MKDLWLHVYRCRLLATAYHYASLDRRMAIHDELASMVGAARADELIGEVLGRTKMLAAIYRLGYSNGWYDATGGDPFNDDIGDVSVMEMLAHEEMTESDPCPICGVTESHICHGAG